MSHQGQATCSIQNANPKTLEGAIQRLLEMYPGARVAHGRAMMKGWNGQKWVAQGTVIERLSIAAYGTDVDVSINARGEVVVNGDENSTKLIRHEVEKAYQVEAHNQALRSKGMRTRVVIADHAARKYAIEGLI